MSLTWIKPSMPLETLVPGDLGPVNEPVGDSDIDEEPEARDIRDCPVEHLTSLRRRDASPSAAGEPPAPRPSPTGSAGPGADRPRSLSAAGACQRARSEERRVGKEGKA